MPAIHTTNNKHGQKVKQYGNGFKFRKGVTAREVYNHILDDYAAYIHDFPEAGLSGDWTLIRGPEVYGPLYEVWGWFEEVPDARD